MSKRAPQFERKAGDYYPTPDAAVEPLLWFLPVPTRFWEPCAGDGSLADRLAFEGHDLMGMSDIAPQRPDVSKLNANDPLMWSQARHAHCFITNPPWDVKLMHPILEALVRIKPTWLLLYSDWLFTRQAMPYLPMASHIVAIGRVKWFPGSKHQGKDNACWVRFDQGHIDGARFYGRTS